MGQTSAPAGDADDGFGRTPIETTADVFLGDRLTIRQPRYGYRAGVDAVLLAASIGNSGTHPKTLLDVGAGVGTVGLCAAARLADLTVVLLERQPELAALARLNTATNGLDLRVRVVEADVTARVNLLPLGLAPESFDAVAANPPFHDDDAGTPATNGLKAASHAMAQDALEHWARFMARMVRPNGRVHLIHKAESLPRLLAVFGPRFGALSVLPIAAREGGDAIRVLITGTKGSRAPLTLHSPFVLHTQGQDFTPAAAAILRHGAPLVQS